MRSPAQHPSRLGSTGELELELGAPVRAPASARRVERAGADSPSRAPSKPVSKAPGKAPISDGPPSSGRGKSWPVQRPKSSSLPPAPEGKPSPFSPSSRPASSRPSAASGQPAPSGPPRASQRPGSDEDDEWADAPLEVGLDLGDDAPASMRDIDAAPAKPKAAAAAKPRVVVGGPAGAAAAAQGATAASAPEPEAGPAPDALEVAALAGYGAPPTNVLVAPLYAYRVVARRRELRELYSLQQRTHEHAKRGVREKQAEIVDKLGAAAPPGALDAALRPIEEARRAVGERKAAMEATSGEVSARHLALDREIEAEQKNKKQLQRDRDMAQIKLEDAVHKRALTAEELKRHNARIEGAHDAARRAAAPGSDLAPPEHATQIVALEAQRAKLAEQLRGRDRAVSEARSALRAREDQVAALESRIQGIHGRQAALDKQGSDAENAGRVALKLAEERLFVAYEEALAAIVRDLPQLCDAPTRAQVEELARASAQCDKELEKHRLAIDAYDHAVYQRGIAMAMGGAAVVLILVILIARVK